jgi:hypothetical protein
MTLTNKAIEPKAIKSKEIVMTSVSSNVRPAPGFTLRQLLVADAVTCLVFGGLLVSGAGVLAPLLGIPAAWLFGAGVVLFPCAALMALAAKTLAPWLAGVVIAGNAAWVVASIAVLFAVEPTSLGVGFVLAQAAAVATLAVLEWKSR